jgi:hypothetical protein
MLITRPDESESAEYYRTYIDRVPEGDLIEFMRTQKDRVKACIRGIPDDRVDYAYAEGKWTTREVIGHILDTEWVFVYRTLRIARGDETPLAGMEQDDFIRGANFSDCPMADLAAQFAHLRSASIELFKTFDQSILDRRGTASGCLFSVRALMFIVAGHAEHHLNVINERYL